MAVIGVNYTEGKKTAKKTYKSVYLHGREKGKVFRSGDFIKDWYNAKKYFMLNLIEKEGMFSQSSSVNHFFFDGADFQSAYQIYDEELYVDENGSAQKRHVVKLKYLEDEPDLLKQREILEGWEFFVPKGARWTWEELKAYVKKGIVPKKKRKHAVAV